MRTLDVPGATLHYQTVGSGPLLVLVPGANGDAEIFAGLTEHLASDFTILTYDRRGFGRSQREDDGEYDDKLRTDADDVRRLIEHCADDQATVLGSSSGGLIALTTLLNHPEIVDTLIAHEPAALSVLPDEEEWESFLEDVMETYEETGIDPAMGLFASRMVSDADAEMMAQPKQDTGDEAFADRIHWFEHELPAVATAHLDFDALTDYAKRLVFLRGQSSEGTPAYRVSTRLAEQTGSVLKDVPGGHLGYTTDPPAFADELQAALDRDR